MANKTETADGFSFEDGDDFVAEGIPADQGTLELLPKPVLRASDSPFAAKASLSFVSKGLVGRGGQALVYRVQSVDDGRAYALKVFRREESAQREWLTLRAHRDDRTVPLAYLFGSVAWGASAGRDAWAIVMEYVEGESLADVLARADARARLTVEESLRIMRPIIRFCANAVTSRRLDVHRDIKPENIILEPDGGVRLIDFGIAACADATSPARGTAGYGAPELADVDATALFDARVDTYSIAATLFALLQDGAPPEPQQAADAVAGSLFSRSLRHDDDLRRAVGRQLADDLAQTYGARMSASVARAALDLSFDLMDAKLERRIAECLDARCERRPSPAELESVLPLDPRQYEQELLGNAIIRYLKRGEREREVLPSADAEVAADREFEDGLDAMNCGLYEKAVPILRKQASRKNTSALYYLGVCIRDGLGPVEYDEQKIAYCFSEAAKRGNVLAQNAFGLMLFRGQGIEQNQDKGLEWIRKSARDDEATGKIGFPVARRWLADNGFSLEDADGEGAEGAGAVGGSLRLS